MAGGAGVAGVDCWADEEAGIAAEVGRGGFVVARVEALRVCSGPDATRFSTGPHSPYEDGR